MAKQKHIPKRSEVEKRFTWATEDLFATDALWEEALEAAKAYPEAISAFRGRLAESPEAPYGYMKLSDEIEIKVARLGNYAMRKSDEDTANPVYQAMRGKIMNLYMTIGSADSFSTPEIISIPDDRMKEYFEAEPGLKLYERKISRIRHFKPHTLSDAEERILALSGQVTAAPGETAQPDDGKVIVEPTRLPDIPPEQVCRHGSLKPG